MIATSIATMKLPKIFPEEWEKSPYHCSNGVLAFFCIAATIVLIVQIYFNLSSLTPALIIGQVVFLVLAIVFAHFRYESGNVKIQTSYEED
ncbi:MAG: hypothetical protein GX299_08655 [Epulopiscium sp.]|nr:hypothetical protein [Candidatus Epulonipiscium sp.]